MRSRQTALDGLAMSLLVVLCASWGVQQVAIKVASAGISPMFQAGLRSAGALGLLWAWSAARGVPILARDGSLGLGLVIGLLFGGEILFIYWGLSYTTAARSVLFLYTAPFFVALGAHVFLPGERLRRTDILGLACAFAGVLAVVADGLTLPDRRAMIGDAMVLLAAILWAATTVVIKASPLAGLSANKTLVYQLGVSAVLLLGLSAGLGEAGLFDPTPRVLAAMAYQTIGVAFASYLVWFWMITRYPASKLSAFSFLTPVFGVLAGAVMLGERVSSGLA
ncbi:DMT family transporter, partial [Rhodospirillum rubrum]